METILNLPDLKMNDNKALNFIIVAHGVTENVNQLVKCSEKAFKTQLAACCANLYDLRTLERAEAIPELLNKPNRFSLQTAKSYWDKSYIGYFHCADYGKLYEHLFSSPKEDFVVPMPPPHYSKNNLLQLLHEKSSNGDRNEQGVFYDFEIEYHYELLEPGKSFATITCHLNSACVKDDMLPHLDWFDAMIQQLDARFPDCFQSAYISFNHPDRAILHTNLYKTYDIHCLNRYILGAEWSVYCSRRIWSHLEKADLQKLAENVSLQSLQNGWQYKAKSDIKDIDGTLRDKLEEALKNVLVPAYGIYSWSELWNSAHAIGRWPQKIHVHAEYDNLDDPTIVFLYNMDVNEINR